MVAAFLGIPLALMIFFVVLKYVPGYNHDGITAASFGAALGICAWYACRGVDILLDRKKDNPPPFFGSLALEDAYSEAKARLVEMHVGPFFMALKHDEPDAGRLVFSLMFSEMLGGFLSPPTEARRHMMLELFIEAVPESEQKPIYEQFAGKNITGISELVGRSKITQKWHVDSPLVRSKANEVIKETAYELKRAVGIPLPEKIESKLAALRPPNWALAILAMTTVGVMLEAESVQRKELEARTKIHTEFEDTSPEESILPWQQPRQGNKPRASSSSNNAEFQQPQRQQNQPSYPTQYYRPQPRNLHLERPQSVEEQPVEAAPGPEAQPGVSPPQVDPLESIRMRFRQGINERGEQ
ncbi:MAG: hypothetical protein QG574_5350 [Cyanobacteriota bacterium erpe_2018_sw_21hr_WHONDRS-SW48-000092_B_bin.40]|jgi:hypothetical protein|nr:hypothetical protein [Cyanobacteriota bacterium erpe_2018_sw_21hr_WHONDRS-SW48-000092_B_bin.40]